MWLELRRVVALERRSAASTAEVDRRRAENEVAKAETRACVAWLSRISALTSASTLRAMTPAACRIGKHGSLLRSEPVHPRHQPIVFRRQYALRRKALARTTKGVVPAIGFVVNPRSDRYVGRLDSDDVVDVLATAAGHWGSCAEYLHETVARLEELGIDPERILGITFTNKAASELAEGGEFLRTRADVDDRIDCAHLVQVDASGLVLVLEQDRYRGDGGQTWHLADLDGPQRDGVLDDPGILTVNAKRKFVIQRNS